MTLIQRNGSDIWTAVEPIDGKKKWWNTGTPDKRTAKARARVYFDGLRRGKFDEVADLVRRKAKVLTIGEFLALYEKLCVKKSATDTGVRPRTWIGYRMSVRTVVGLVLDAGFNKNHRKLTIKKRKERNDLVDRQPLTVLDGTIVRRYIKLVRERAKGTEEL